jgi:hypothetical protein
VAPAATPRRPGETAREGSTRSHARVPRAVRPSIAWGRGILGPVRLAPWEYLTQPFEPELFPDLFNLTWVAALVLLVVLVVLYNVRTRALHRHRPYVDMWEWLMWAGVSAFGLVLVGTVFAFEFWLVLVFEVVGLGTLAWIRFVKFPPELQAYQVRLDKQRYARRTRFTRPEATIRQRPVRRSRRRR